MPNIEVKLRRGTEAEHDTTNGGFKGAVGEVTVDTTNKTLRVHDGSTVGGIRLAKHSELAAGAIFQRNGLQLQRFIGTTYVNSNNKARFVNVGYKATGSASLNLTLYMNTGTSGSPTWSTLDSVVLTLGANEEASVSSFIMPGTQYKVELGSTTNLVQERWIELI